MLDWISIVVLIRIRRKAAGQMYEEMAESAQGAANMGRMKAVYYLVKNRKVITG